MASHQDTEAQNIVITTDPTTGEVCRVTRAADIDEMAPNETAYAVAPSGELLLVADGTLPPGILAASPRSHAEAAPARCDHWNQPELRTQRIWLRALEARLTFAGFKAYIVRIAGAEWVIGVEDASPEELFVHHRRVMGRWTLLYQHLADLPGELSHASDLAGPDASASETAAAITQGINDR